ncbi:ORF15 [Ranid herpesvirus 1]|uniref:ORF15 n=1 Tax=Ranid herpesvirus 1 TaxID=85655 RepID=Q14VU3_9VIRU|nr:ORF15 [Ranid herpesvirus 1]ABG25752.1 ORF15 [Ranid herpesvirus 1]
MVLLECMLLRNTWSVSAPLSVLTCKAVPSWCPIIVNVTFFANTTGAVETSPTCINAKRLDENARPTSGWGPLQLTGISVSQCIPYAQCKTYNLLAPSEVTMRVQTENSNGLQSVQGVWPGCAGSQVPAHMPTVTANVTCDYVFTDDQNQSYTFTQSAVKAERGKVRRAPTITLDDEGEMGASCTGGSWIFRPPRGLTGRSCRAVGIGLTTTVDLALAPVSYTTTCATVVVWAITLFVMILFLCAAMLPRGYLCFSLVYVCKQCKQ